MARLARRPKPPEPTRDKLERFTVRLSPQVLAAIDDARDQRAGIVSRNTWITEAVHEKLSKQRASMKAANE